ncbi:MAG: hypothetical protein JNL92_23755 [Opitutaceae bacterium]|nr:hypothetical protein [Opitutaceae bacterium]
MNTPLPSPPPAPRRRIWLWVAGLCLVPFVVLALVAVSYLSLERDAAALRRQVMRATAGAWTTQVQVSVGSVTLGGLRTALAFVGHPHAATARRGLRAVSRASVGVYRRKDSVDPGRASSLLLGPDRGMQQRGWTRLVGAQRRDEWVVVYVAADAGTGRSMECCVAVLKPRELVVVSVALEADALGEFLSAVLSGEFTGGEYHRRWSAGR